MFQRVPCVDGCDLASTLCTYDLRKVDLFGLSWARVRRGSICSEQLICGGGVHSLFYCLLWNVCCVSAVVLTTADSVFLSLGVLKCCMFV